MTIQSMTNKQRAEAKNDHVLHVGLVQKQEGVTRGAAQILAYLEGQSGLKRRLQGPGVWAYPELPVQSTSFNDTLMAVREMSEAEKQSRKEDAPEKKPAGK